MQKKTSIMSDLIFYEDKMGDYEDMMGDYEDRNFFFSDH